MQNYCMCHSLLNIMIIILILMTFSKNFNLECMWVEHKALMWLVEIICTYAPMHMLLTYYVETKDKAFSIIVATAAGVC